jgi:nucleosome-remodeling factor subunit BPTF
MVMKSMLDKIEREEKLEQKRQKKQESAEERQKRLTSVSQQRALFKHKEALKKDILKKRAAMEKSLQQEIFVSKRFFPPFFYPFPLEERVDGYANRWKCIY